MKTLIASKTTPTLIHMLDNIGDNLLVMSEEDKLFRALICSELEGRGVILEDNAEGVFEALQEIKAHVRIQPDETLQQWANVGNTNFRLVRDNVELSGLCIMQKEMAIEEIEERNDALCGSCIYLWLLPPNGYPTCDRYSRHLAKENGMPRRCLECHDKKGKES